MQPLANGPAPAGPRRGCRGGAGNRLWIGLLLIGLGTLFALANYGYVDMAPFWRLWPLFLIFFGLRSTLRHRGRNAGGLILLLLGIWFLARNFDLVPLDGRLFPASILVIVGFSFALSALVPRRPPSAVRGGAPVEAGALVRATAVLGAVSQASTAADFRGGSAVAFLGSCEIDLRQAAIAGGEAVLEVSALWGGVRIYVPTSWAVVIEGTPLLGSFHDLTRQPAASSQRLVVTGFALMGGVDVENEPTVED